MTSPSAKEKYLKEGHELACVMVHERGHPHRNDMRDMYVAGAESRDEEVKRLSSIIERGDAIKNCWENNEYQEAAHYTWLDDQNEKLEVQNTKLWKLLEQGRKALTCPTGVVQSMEMHTFLSDLASLRKDYGRE